MDLSASLIDVPALTVIRRKLVTEATLVATAEAKGAVRPWDAMRPQQKIDAIEASALTHAPDKHMRMPSGAGHDAQIIGLKLPAAMMFVPSIGGISHHFSENTADGDIVLGCQVFADATAKILKGN